MTRSVLVAVVAFHASIVLFLALLLPEVSIHRDTAYATVFISHTLLLGLWIAFGWERLQDKVGCIAVVGALMGLAFYLHTGLHSGRTFGEPFHLSVACGAIFYLLGAFAASAPIAISRAWGSLIELAPVDEIPVSPTAGLVQFSIARLLAWMVAAALTLALGRALSQIFPLASGPPMLVFLIWLYATCLVMLREPLWPLPDSWQLLTLLLASLAVGLMQAWGGNSYGQVYYEWGYAVAAGSMTLAAVATLLAVRSTGYRLAWVSLELRLEGIRAARVTRAHGADETRGIGSVMAKAATYSERTAAAARQRETSAPWDEPGPPELTKKLRLQMWGMVVVLHLLALGLTLLRLVPESLVTRFELVVALLASESTVLAMWLTWNRGPAVSPGCILSPVGFVLGYGAIWLSFSGQPMPTGYDYRTELTVGGVLIAVAAAPLTWIVFQALRLGWRWQLDDVANFTSRYAVRGPTTGQFSIGRLVLWMLLAALTLTCARFIVSMFPPTMARVMNPAPFAIFWLIVWTIPTAVVVLREPLLPTWPPWKMLSVLTCGFIAAAGMLMPASLWQVLPVAVYSASVLLTLVLARQAGYRLRLVTLEDELIEVRRLVESDDADFRQWNPETEPSQAPAANPAPDTTLPAALPEPTPFLLMTMQAAWDLRPGVNYLNHGSFGACPRVVLGARESWTRRLASEPMDFFTRQLDGLFDETAAAIGRLVGAPAGDLALVENATVGMNIVAASFPLAPGDEVLINDHEYGAVLRIWERTCQRAGARLVVAPLTVPIASADDVVAQLLAPANERTKLIVVSHVTSPTAIVLPIEPLCRAARARGLAVCIDGPHAPVMVPVDITGLDCDYYTASLHKWCCAPLGAGFLYVHPRRQESVQPAIVSWGKTLTDRPKRWTDEFHWTGSRDPAAILSVPAAIEFLESAGLNAFRQHTHGLAQHARHTLEALTGRAALVPDDLAWYGSMIAMPLSPGDAPSLQRALWEQAQIEVPIVAWQGQRLVRVSCHWYTSKGQIDALAAELTRLGERR